MTLDTLKDHIPDWARDLRINLGLLEKDDALSAKQRWSVALSAAIAARQPELIAAIDAAALSVLTPAERDAAASAAAVMAMNNVYYRFTHLCGDETYSQMPARLRMQVIGRPGIPKLDFELLCLAVSAVNGCGACMASHTKSVVAEGARPEIVHEAVRIASVIHGVACVLDATPHLAVIEQAA